MLSLVTKKEIVLMRKSNNAINRDSVKSINRLLQVVLYGALIISVLLIVLPLFMKGLELSLDSEQGEVIVKPEELKFAHRSVFAFLYSLTIFCWVFGLFWLLRLSRRFATGDVFNKENTHCVKMFAYSLILMALVEPTHEALAMIYLASVEHIEATVDLEIFSFVSQMDYIVSAVAILLICAVLDKAVDLSEESKLTI